MPEANLYTVLEAAYVAGTDERAVNREIDAGIIRPRPSRRRGRRLLAEDCLYYLASVKRLRNELGHGLRREMRDKLATALRRRRDAVELGGVFVVKVSQLRRDIGHRLGDVESLRDIIVSDPRIAGGEPVIRGTRHRVHHVARLINKGVSMAEFRKEYDLTAKQVRAAALYARLHPRLGRPERARRRDVIEHVSAD